MTIGFYLRNLFDPKKDAFLRLKQRLDSMKQNTNLFLGASTYLVTTQVQEAVIDVREWDTKLIDCTF